MVSRVLFRWPSISALAGRLPRHLGSCSHFRPARRAAYHACGAHTAVDSEIAAGRITLFTPHPRGGIGLCCSHLAVPVWTVRAYDRPCPRFHVAPCSMQLGLSSTGRPAAATLAFWPCPTLLSHGTRCGPWLLLRSLAGSGTGIRTPIDRFKVCCPTIRRSRRAGLRIQYTACKDV